MDNTATTNKISAKSLDAMSADQIRDEVIYSPQFQQLSERMQRIAFRTYNSKAAK